MSTPILVTKLYIPPSRPQIIRRARLIERLNEGLLGKLTLISAPAGFGKTTLVSGWVIGCQRPTAWLSLDERDNDPIRFLTHLVAALQTILPNFGEGVLNILQSPQPPSEETLLTVLLNEIAILQDNFILVLDDYHVVDAKPVDSVLTFLLEHLPAQIHLVIVTRADPELQLARLRARGQLNELRVADLRFTPSEAGTFLNQVMGLALSTKDVDALETRTEGWIAGLQLAALALQDHQASTASFINSFTGSHRFVLDYLVEEVLERQPESVQAFLLRTSILDRMCGSLCDAVVKAPGGFGEETLTYLERANLFIVPLDDERRWYRYHHLFTDLLRKRLHQSQISLSTKSDSENINELHRRASAWYEDNGLGMEAFHHAVAANDIERAERLIEVGAIPRHFRGAVVTMLDWLASLPTVVLDTKPSLWVKYATLLLVNGQTTGVEDKLQAAEEVLPATYPDDKIRNLIGQIAAARATLALTQYEVDVMITQSCRALEYLPADSLSFRATACWTLGYAYQLQGNRVGASRSYTEAIAISQASGNVFFTILATIGLGQVQELENQLYLAVETYHHSLHLFGEYLQPNACEAHLGLARIYYEWNDLDAAEKHGQQALQLAQEYDQAIDRFVVCTLFCTRLKLAQGAVTSAITLIEQAEQYAHQHNFIHRMSEIAAAKVLALLQQGNLVAAAELTRTHELPLSQIRVLLAQGDTATAVALLKPLRQQIEAKGWVDEQLKIMVLYAVASHLHGEEDNAVRMLTDALVLAAPSGFIRVFIDEGLLVKHLLQAVVLCGIAPEYVQRLLAAFSLGGTEQAISPTMVDALSERELEVLQYIAAGLTNQEIATQLYLSLYTVKVHARNIYSKLGVNNRTRATAKARERGILPRF